MTRLLSEGWETQSLAQWTAYGFPGYSWVAGRTGGRGSYSLRSAHGMYYVDHSYISKNLGTNKEELYVRFYVRYNTPLNNTESETIRFLDSAGADVLSVRVRDNSLTPIIQAYRTSTALGEIQPQGWLCTTWSLFEVYAKNSVSETTLTVKLDGAQIFTQTWGGATGAGDLRTVEFRSYRINNSEEFDDIAINDTSGAINNSWIGNGSIVALVPTSTVDAQLMGSDSNQVNNHELIDELVTDNDTTYVVSGEAAADTYGLATLNLGAGERINCVQPIFRGRKEGATTLGARMSLKSGETVQSDVMRDQMTASYTTYYGEHAEVDPDTEQEWTEEAMNALKLIIEVL